MISINHNGETTFIHDEMARLYRLQNGSTVVDHDLYMTILYNNRAWVMAGFISKGAVLKAKTKPFG